MTLWASKLASPVAPRRLPDGDDLVSRAFGSDDFRPRWPGSARRRPALAGEMSDAGVGAGVEPRRETSITEGQRAPRSRIAGGVQSLERAFELLELMAAAGGEIGLSQLASDSGLPLPTIHRLVRTLVAGGYMLQLPSRRYALGPRLIGLGASASHTVERGPGRTCRARGGG